MTKLSAFGDREKIDARLSGQAPWRRAARRFLTFTPKCAIGTRPFTKLIQPPFSHLLLHQLIPPSPVCVCLDDINSAKT
jgi:hypothetical protein